MAVAERHEKGRTRAAAIGRLVLGRPRTVLAVWALAITALAAVGFGVADRLHRTNLVVEGTESARAVELTETRFGDGSSLVVLLEGPEAALDRQGPRLAAALERLPSVTVLSPWAEGARSALRPRRGRALLMARADLPFERASQDVVPRVRETVDRAVADPVAWHVSGSADIAAGIHGGTVAAIRHAERLAAPILLLVLLLVFRSPVAAGLPLVVGVATIGAGSGVLALANELTALDAAALNMTSMMGLALGVDYSLLIVTRFREELARGHDTAAAVRVAMRTAGRTVGFAGAALVLAMAVAYFTAPGDLLTSASVGVIIAAAISMLAALGPLPAMLVLLGPNVDRWRFARRRARSGRLGGALVRGVRRPAVTAVVVAVLVAGLSAPALGLETGPPDPRVLPSDSRERQDFEAIHAALGGAWTSPYEITLAVPTGTVTEPRRLRALERWQDRVAALPGVQAVMGPAEIARRARTVERGRRRLAGADAELARAERDQRRLELGLARAGAGAGALRKGLADAGAGAALLRSGGARATAGAAQLRAGLARAGDGASRLRTGLAQARAGAAGLSEGAARAAAGARRLRAGLVDAASQTGAGLPRVRELEEALARGGRDLARLREPVGVADRELRRALAALRRMAPTSKLDPAYADVLRSVSIAAGAVSGRNPLTGRPVASDYDGLDAALAGGAEQLAQGAAAVSELRGRLTELERGLVRLRRGAGELEAGVARLESGTRDLRAGIDELAQGGTALGDGLARLEAGARELTGGLDGLEAGAGELERGLSGGAGRTRELHAGLDRMAQGTAGARVRTRKLASGLDGGGRLDETLSSGYFLLAALDAAPRERRNASTFAVNLDRGGSAAKIVVIGEGDVGRSGHPLRARLSDELPRLERATGGTAVLGGAAAVLQDFDGETLSRMWILVIALSAVAYAALVAALRSLLLPLVAVLLNLVTVAAAFGVLVLLFQGAAPLGGPGFLDAIMVAGVFSVVFGLSIDYEFFLLTRMREGYELTGTTDGAIAYGLRKTAGVITGAALIMTGVFVAFAVTDIANARQLGVGLTVAVLLDATLVRLLLLPAMIRLCGRAAWWFPRATAVRS